MSIDGYTIVSDIQIGVDVAIRRARRDSDHKPVIIKSAPKDNEIALDRLRNHFKLCSEKVITGTPKVYDLISTPDELQLIMEDTGSTTLSSLVRRGAVDIGEALLISEQILVALDALHGMNILHRDMSLANVIYDAQTHHTTIADLGLAVNVHPNRPEHTSPRVEGTLAFMSPEQTGRTQRPTDARSDIYSTGIILYALFTGATPFQCEDALEYFHAHLAITPKAPVVVRPELPIAISNLIMIMLAKDPDDRYQSVYGVLEDIRRIRHLYISGADTTGISLMANDTSARFDTSGKLFGRKFEFETLGKLVTRSISTGPVVFTVFGAIGSGKSALLNEFSQRTRAQGITVLHGKHEQFSGGLPATGLHAVIHAFQSKILKLPSTEVHEWSLRLQQALGENSRQLVRVFPELSVLLGPESGSAEVGATESSVRLQNALVAILLEISKGLGKCVVILEDIQWADETTTNVLRELRSVERGAPLLFIETIRSEFISKTADAEYSVGVIADTDLALEVLPLNSTAVREMLSDALHCTEDRVSHLSTIVSERTGGNPLHAHQYLQYLVESQLVRYNRQKRTWDWDTEEVKAHRIEFDVSDIVADRLSKCSPEHRYVLGLAATFGATFSELDLRKATGYTEAVIAAAIDNAMVMGLVHTIVDGDLTKYRFRHDRFQQAAIEQLSIPERVRCHSSIATSLLASWHGEGMPDNLFALVEHVNQSIEEIQVGIEREKALNVLHLAAVELRSAGALMPALTYIRTYRTAKGWNGKLGTEHADFSSSLLLAECAGSLGFDAEADEKFKRSIALAKSPSVRASARAKYIQFLTKVGRFQEVLEEGSSALKELDFKFNSNPSKLDVAVELIKTFIRMRKIRLDEIPNRSFNRDDQLQLTDDVLYSLSTPGYNFSAELLTEVFLGRFRLAVQLGHGPTTIDVFTSLGLILVGLGMYSKADAYSEASLSLVDASDNLSAKCRAILIAHGNVRLWSRPISECLEGYQRAEALAVRSGNQHLVLWALGVRTQLRLFSGEFLPSIHEWLHQLQEILYTSFQRRTNLPFTATYFGAAVAKFISSVNHSCQVPKDLKHMVENSDDLVEEMKSSKDATALCSWFVADIMSGAYLWKPGDALIASANFKVYMHGSITQTLEVDYHFYTAIAHSQHFIVKKSGRRESLKNLKKAVGKFTKWNKSAPSSFSYRLSLLTGLEQMIRGRGQEAIHWLQDAAQRARTNGHHGIEGLAHDFLSIVNEEYANTETAMFHKERAVSSFRSWGATVCADRLERHEANGRTGRQGALASSKVEKELQSFSTSSTIVHQQLDVESVFKASSAISGEILYENLSKRLLSIVMENAGADNGLLLVEREGQFIVQAQARAGNGVDFFDGLMAEGSDLVFQAGFNLARSTGQLVVIDNAISDTEYKYDTFVSRHNSRSIMMVPVIHQTRTIGILQLENRKVAHAFTADRTKVLKLLLSQIAISLENSWLYEEQLALTRSLERFVPTEFIQSLGKTSITTVGIGDAVEREITILFADIRGFTSLAEKLSVQNTFAFLNEFLSHIEPAISENSGFIDKYIGDAVMALFPGSPKQAVDAALQIQKNVGELNNIRVAQGMEPVLIGIGLHVGTVMIGTVGSKSRMDTTVIGDPVNVAARLEEMTKNSGHQILASGEVIQYLDVAKYNIVPVHADSIRGRTGSLSIFSVS